jgi:hypothetical protein
MADPIFTPAPPQWQAQIEAEFTWNHSGVEAKPGPSRIIDFPLEDLPHVDEHGILVHASVETVWEALLAVNVAAASRRRGERLARALGCAHTEASGPIDRIGSTVPGFIVARVIEPAALALEGEHRFSRYGLVWSLEPTRDERTLLRAETRAEFPGVKGRLYRFLLIRTNLHVLAVNRLLRAVKRRAEQAAPAPGPG